MQFLQAICLVEEFLRDRCPFCVAQGRGHIYDHSLYDQPVKIVDFQPEHLLRLKIQERQTEVEQSLEYGKALMSAGPAWTGLDGERVVFCAGKAEQWAGRYVLWAILAKEAKRHMLQITRAVKRGMLLLEDGARFEAIVQSDFEQGHRWASMVGMRWHHHEERFLPDGTDADIYVRFT